MASINLTPGTLSPPACYASEQDRFNAYVAKIVSTILGGIQWEDGIAPPIDLALYWLRKMSDGRYKGIRKYTADGRWVPLLESRWIPDSFGGVLNAYTATTGHSLVAASVQRTGVSVLFVAAATNTGASTLDVDGTGPIAIKRHGNTDLQAGDIVSGGIYEVIYNATGARWELATPVPPNTVTAPTYVPLTGAVPAAANITAMPHGQFKAPEFIDVRLVCIAADRGYSIGDEVSIESFFWSGLGTGVPAFTVERDTTNVRVIRLSDAPQTVFVTGKGAGAAYDVAANMASWTIKADCQFLP
jgi:hypothetical protein